MRSLGTFAPPSGASQDTRSRGDSFCSQHIAHIGRCFAGMFLAISFLQPAVRGQNFGMGPIDTRGRFIEAPRAVLQLIADARQAIENKRSSDAVLLLGELLAREPVLQEESDLIGQDFFLDAAAGDDLVQQSMLAEAERLIGELDRESLSVYELRYGPKAQQMLERASNNQDRELLRDVSRRYLNTRAGQQATLLLADLELSEGRPTAALGIYRRLASIASARTTFGDPLIARLAGAEFLAGRDSAAEEHLRAAAQDGLQVSISGVPQIEGIEEGKELAWLRTHFGATAASRVAPADALRVPLGGASSTGAGGGELPLSLLRWEVPTTADTKQSTELRSFSERGARNVIPAPSWQPIFARDQLFMRTTQRMIAIDFATGIRLWEYPWTSTPEEQVEGTELEIMEGQGASNELFVQRVWNDLPYGRLTSDGTRLFLLNHLTGVEHMPLGQMRMMGIRTTESKHNALVALDIQTEGKLLWVRGKGANEPSELSLADAFFLSPPLPVEGALYVLAEIAGDTFLLSLDPSSGSELWRQQLVGNESTTIETDPIRRIAGAFPAFRDGILVCPTGSGAVLAIDLNSRSLLWGNPFPRNDSSMLNRGGRFQQQPTSLQQDYLNRWFSGTPVISSSGAVLVTPVETDRLYGYDLLTGQPLWPAILRQNYLYLAGIRGNRFFLVGANQMMGFDLASGRPAWSAPLILEGNERIAGTGVFGEDCYLLPTNQQAILQVDLQTGKIIERRQTEYPQGNLLAVRDSIVSQSATMLAVAYQQESLRPVVQEMLAQTPDSPWALVRQGELLLQEGKREEAIASLLRAREQAPDDEDVRVRLVTAVLQSIRSGDRPSAVSAALLDELIELPSQRIELLRLRVEEALAEGQGLAAARHLAELSRLILRSDQDRRTSEPTMITIGPSLQVSFDAWIGARMDLAWQRMSPADQEQWTVLLENEVPSILGSAPRTQRRFLHQFGDFAPTDRIRKGLFDTAVEDALWVAAERSGLEALESASSPPDRERMDAWRAALVKLYLRTNFLAEAAAYAAELDPGSAWRQDPLVASAIAAAPAPHAWPAGIGLRAGQLTTPAGVQVAMPPGMRRPDRNPVDVIARRGRQMELWQPMGSRSGRFEIRSPMGQPWPLRTESIQANNELVQASLDGGLMVMLTPTEMIALDLFAPGGQQGFSEILWRRPWRDRIGSGAINSRSEHTFFRDRTQYYRVSSERAGDSASGVVWIGPIVGNQGYFLQASEVIAYDVSTGEDVWRSSGHSKETFIVADRDSVAVLGGDNTLQILRASDGVLREQRPWEPSEIVHLSAGPHLLTSRKEAAAQSPESSESVIRLVSPLTNQQLLTFRVPAAPQQGEADACAKIIDGRYLVLMTAAGRLIVWDLLVGESICEEDVEFTGTISSLYAILWENGIVVCLTRAKDRALPDGSTATMQYVHGVEHVDIDGPIIMVDRREKKIAWTKNLEDAWGVTINQPGSNPLLLLSRGKRTFTNPGKPLHTLDVLAIDTRDGSEAIRVDAMQIESNNSVLQTDIQVRPQENFVDVAIERYIFIFDFGPDVLPAQERIFSADRVRELHARSAAEGIRPSNNPPPLVP